jgi:hypothetical protein
MKSILSVDQFEKWDAMKSKQEKKKVTKNTKKEMQKKTILFKTFGTLLK